MADDFGRYEVIEELGKADASTAWAINQGGIFATFAARMPPEAARARCPRAKRATFAGCLAGLYRRKSDSSGSWRRELMPLFTE